MNDTPRLLGIVIPCFNEASRLDLAAFAAFARQHPSWDLLFVDDASTDATLPALQAWQARIALPNIQIITMAHQGKAAAVQTGIQSLLAQPLGHQALGFYDADEATPLDELERLGNLFLTPSFLKVDALFASRIQYLGTHIKRHWWRHYLGRIFATAVSLMVRLPIYDSQCGLKLFKTPIAARVFQEKFISPWFFDVELVFRLQSSAAVIQECPLKTWIDQDGSKLRWRDFWQTPLELAKIYRHYRHQDHHHHDY